MKKFFLLFILCSILSSAYAQTVKVRKEKSTIKGESCDGYAVDLEGTNEEVTAAFQKLHKTLGKAKKAEYTTINEPNLNGLTYQQPLFANTSTAANSKTTTAWLGYDAKAFSKEDAEKLDKELDKVMKDFGIKYYRDKIQIQIDESITATQAVEKQKQRLVNENKSLIGKVDYNKREKVELLKSLEQNRLDSINLVKKLELNKKAQDSVAVAGEQVKKVLEAQKEKQRKVN